MIKVKNLTKTYRVPVKKKGWLGLLANIFARKHREVLALDKVSFQVKEGELIGLIGPNGAGKTTTMKILSGILYPTSGQVSVLGFVPEEKKSQFLKQIAFIMGQRNQLLWDLPAVDTFSLNKEIYQIGNKEYKKTLDNLVSLLNCGHLIDQPVKTLSLGERMRMELIASLIHQPKVLFLDEPTIGLDVVGQKTIRDFIKNYQKLYQATIILTSHYMEDVRQLAERVVMINFGQIVYDGSLEALVKKYTEEKVISLVVGEMPDKKTLKEINDIWEINFPQIVFKVKKGEIPQKINLISQKLKFLDLNIEEERIEDVIGKIFERQSNDN